MAYVPDEAIDKMTELSAGAWRLYCFLARCRNQKTGKCCPSINVTMETIGTKRSQTFELRKELIRNGWAVFDGNHVISLFGFNSPENRTGGDENKTVAANSPENRTVAVNSPKNRTVQSEKSDSIVRKTGLAYKEEPAKGTSKEEPAKQQHADARESRFSIEQIRAYIKATKKHVYSVSGLTRYLKSNGDEDELIAAWIEAEELKVKLRDRALEDAAHLEQNFDWDGWIDTCIKSGWTAQLKAECEIIEGRGGAKLDWERRVVEYFQQPTTKEV